MVGIVRMAQTLGKKVSPALRPGNTTRVIHIPCYAPVRFAPHVRTTRARSFDAVSFSIRGTKQASLLRQDPFFFLLNSAPPLSTGLILNHTSLRY